MKKRLLFTSFFVMTLCACQEENEEMLDFTAVPVLPQPVVPRLSVDEIKSKGEQMFEDGESVEEIVSSERAFYVDNPFYASVKDGELRVFNGMYYNFRNVKLSMAIPQFNDTIMLMEFEEVPGFYDVRTESPLKMGEAFYRTKSGKTVRTNNLALLMPEQYKFILECNDSIFDMLKTIKMKTRIQMGEYGQGNWGVMTPNAARYYATSTINLAVMFSSDIFRDSLINYKGRIHDDAGKDIDREGLIKSILNKQSIIYGVVKGNNIAGMGGGSNLGLREEYLPGFFYENRVTLNSNWAIHVWIHELGHTLGYGHSSSMCYNAVPDEIAPSVYRYMMKNKLLPYIINPFKEYNNYKPGVNESDNPNIKL